MANRCQNLVEKIYKSFNDRKIGDVLLYMDEEVKWPNGWEGGYLTGKEAVKDYWTRQWKELDPRVIPLAINEPEEGLVKVKVHQVVKDLQGKLLSDAIVSHTYIFENGLIKKWK